MELNDNLEVYHSTVLQGMMEWCDLLEEWNFRPKTTLSLKDLIEVCLLIHELEQRKPNGI